VGLEGELFLTVMGWGETDEGEKWTKLFNAVNGGIPRGLFRSNRFIFNNNKIFTRHIKPNGNSMKKL